MTSSKFRSLDAQSAPSASQTILKAGIVAGILDFVVSAVVYFFYAHLNPIQIGEYIASSLLGTSAYQDGIAAFALGCVIHFALAFAVAIVYFLLYPRIKVLQNQKVIMGLIYGVAVWLVINLLLIPLTAIGHQPFDGTLATINMIGHALTVGLPIALITAKHFPNIGK